MSIFASDGQSMHSFLTGARYNRYVLNFKSITVESFVFVCLKIRDFPMTDVAVEILAREFRRNILGNDLRPFIGIITEGFIQRIHEIV